MGRQLVPAQLQPRVMQGPEDRLHRPASLQGQDEEVEAPQEVRLDNRGPVPARDRGQVTADACQLGQGPAAATSASGCVRAPVRP